VRSCGGIYCAALGGARAVLSFFEKTFRDGIKALIFKQTPQKAAVRVQSALVR
jgi:hypothetical protein